MTNASPSLAAPTTAVGDADREIVLTRRLPAPPELVYAAWTDPNQITKWWGPHGFTTTTHAMAVRPGGVWRFTMHGPDGVDYPNRIDYIEVTPPERLEYWHSDDSGPMAPFHVVTTFEPRANDTVLTMRLRLISAAEREAVVKFGAVDGGLQTVERLARHLATLTGVSRPTMALALPSPLEVVLTREFDAPRQLVFDACSKPEHMRRWWGPRELTFAVCEMDVRVGGAYRFVLRNSDGVEFPFRGVYHEIAPPDRLVFTQIFDVEPFSAYPSTVTITLTEIEGKTTVSAAIRHQTREPRDDEINSGMEHGAAESYNRLAELLATLA